jgi:hypothetical protein
MASFKGGTKPLLLTLLLLAMLFVCAVGAMAATYYVNASGGLDTNTGLSAALSWKTINKTRNFAGLAAGDTILFA